MNIKKYLLGAGVALAGIFIASSTSAITLQVGSGANFDWCAVNSGIMLVDYNDCIGLAWLYQETNGASR